MPNLPDPAISARAKPDQQLEDFYAGRQEFQQVKAAWIERKQAEQARDLEINRQWQAEQ